jgi:pimeloyl-ACP methyl ester carboxylesterase
MRRVIVEVDGIPLSALVHHAPEPRAVIVALHGGATTSVYFDAPGHPHLSLVRTAAALGFSVVALDRPGYGASVAHGDSTTSAEQRVEVTYKALDELLAERPVGAGLFVVAHSRGCDLGIRLAGEERGAELLGLEIAGTGRHYSAHTLAVWEARRNGLRPEESTRFRDLLWGPARLYPPEFASAAGIVTRGPAYDSVEGETWPDDFPDLAARVRIPVEVTIGEYDLWWAAGPSALTDLGTLFSAAPRVELNEQAGVGHNLSLGWGATAYHLRVLSFVEECIQARVRPPEAPPGPRPCHEYR